MIGIDRSAGSGLNPARGRVAVHGRQLDVHQDEIGPLFCDGSERLLTTLRLRDFVVGRGQHISDDLAIVGVVLDYQNALLMPAPSAARRRLGV